MSCKARGSSAKIFLTGYPHHYMAFSRPDVRVRIALRSQLTSKRKSNSASAHEFCVAALLLDARPIIKVEEVYRAYELEPVYYFSRNELLFDWAAINGCSKIDAPNRVKPFLVQNSKSTCCPLKGYTAYFDAYGNASRSVENVAWSYTKITNPDSRASVLRDLIAFDSDLVDIQLVG